ncbi:MAG: hypothetical protein KDB27_34105, partial [Planctomycetales bacterium]|nr:hypothetical protein [Planctomycetales bacterium]
IQTQLSTAERIETLFQPGHGSVISELESFFDEVHKLTAHPDNVSSQTLAVRSLDRLVTESNRLSRELNSMLSVIDEQADQAIRQIEQLSEDIVKLDLEIKAARLGGEAPNNLLDRRAQRLQELAELIDVEVDVQRNIGTDETFPEYRYRLADGFTSFGTKPIDLATAVDEDGRLMVKEDGKDRLFNVTAGKLGGMLTARNELGGKYTDNLDEFTRELFGRLNTINATGLGLETGYPFVVGGRLIEDLTVPLNQLEGFSNIKAGELFVNVVAPDGTQSLHRVEIDPAVDSANDMVAALDAIPFISANIDPAVPQLTLAAYDGYQFNFTGALATSLDLTSVAGTVVPKLSGKYTGPINREITFTMPRDGVIGLTAGLQLEVYEGSKALGVFDIGEGYEPGTEISIGEGVSITMSEGTVVAGDTFESFFVAEPDTANFLTSAGINNLILGDGLGQYYVNPEVMEDTSRLATRHFGEPLDTTNAIRMLEVRDEAFFSNGTQTPHQFFTEIITTVGTDSADLAAAESALATAGEALRAKQLGISGVDPNEEMVRMLQYQRAFQSAARFIVSVDETLEELFNIIR